MVDKADSCSVLVVDDDEGLLSLVQNKLGQEGLQVTGVNRGTDAIAWCEYHHVDLVLFGHTLPDMSGKEFMEALRWRERLIAFVVMVGQEDERLGIEMMRHGAHDYLVKHGNYLESLSFTAKRAIEQSRSEQKLQEAEQALRQSEAMYRTLAENSPNVIMAIDRDGHILYRNKALPSPVVGDTRDDNFFDQLAPAFRHTCRERVAEIFHGGQAAHFDCATDGPTLWQVRIAPIETGQQIIAVMVILIDITERQKADASTAKERNLLRTLIDHLPDQVFVKDIKGRFVLANAATVRVLGAQCLNEVIGKHDYDFLLDTEAEAYFAEELEITRSGQPMLNCERFYTNIKGQTGWIVSTKVPWHDEQGNVVGIVGLNRDVTEQKRAEEALRESHRFLQAVLDGLSAHIAVLNKKGAILMVNQAWRNFAKENDFGDPNAGIGENYLDICRSAKGDWQESASQVADAIVRICEGRQTLFCTEYACHSPKEQRWFEMRVSPLVYQGQHGAIIAHTEITERKRSHEEREYLEEQIRHLRKLEAVGTLAAGVAHNFNNLTMAILGYAGLARSLVAGNRDVLKPIEGIEQAAQQANEVTKSLLMFSRKATVAKVPVHLGELVKEAVAMLRPIMPDAIEITTNLSSSPPLWVEGDASQLQQVVMNLAVNARDAMPEGGQLQLTVRHESEALRGGGSRVPRPYREVAVLVVTDTGIGIPEELRDRIFEPFFTTKPRENGSGLGMAVVHGIVVDHKGEITVDSQEGHGTRITMKIPCCDPPMKTASPFSMDESTCGHGETIILAEDNPQIQLFMSAAMETAGYKVVVVSDGIEAMQAFDAHRADARLVILDLNLPKKSGLCCIREIRDVSPDLPIAIVTGGDASAVNKLADSKVFLLRKPFHMSALTALVNQWLVESVEE